MKPDYRYEPPPDLHAFWLLPLVGIILFVLAVLAGMR